MNRSYQLAALLLATLVVRTVVTIAWHERLQADPDSYQQIAVNLRDDGIYGLSSSEGPRPTAFRPPVYPFLLSLLVQESDISPVAIGVVHVAMGLLTVWLTFLVGQRWGLKLAWLAAAMVALDPILLNQSALAMTETTATLLAILGLWTLTKYQQQPSVTNLLAGSCALTIAALCRPTFLVWQAFVFLAIIARQGSPRASRVRHAAIFAVSSAVLLLPWTIRNYQHFQKPIFATTHGGYTLLLGNNRFFFAHLGESSWGAVWDSNEFDEGMKNLSASDDPAFDFWSDEATPGRWRRNEAESDRFSYRIALAHIGEKPGMFVYSCLIKLGRLWAVIPHQTNNEESTGKRLSRYAVGAWYAGLFALSIASVARDRRLWLRGPWLWGLLLVIALSLVHTLFWSNMRMRAPLMPIICLAAVAALRKPEAEDSP